MEILRAKYKISKDWLRADPSKSASPIWRAIEQAKKVIIKGACYAIGDGSNIDVWKDPWVPWIEGFIPTPRVATYNLLPILVSHLIATDMHCWKSSLIHELFDPSSAQAILSMPVLVTPTPDKLIWIPESKGCFSVKSAYHTIRTLSNPPHPTDTDWKKLWKLKMPEKTKMFLWRLAVNTLPTRDNLSRRFQIVDTSCLFCKENIETPIHLFLNCNASRAFWFSACWGFRPEQITISNTEDIIKLVLHPPELLNSESDQGMVSLNMALILEEIWQSRNRVLHHAIRWDILDSIRTVQTRFQVCSSSLFSPTSPLTHPIQQHWTPPPAGWIKINVDAAVSSNLASIAVFARNHLGTPIKAWARTIRISTPLQAETKALLWAIQLARIEKWSHVLFEGDAKQCFDAINAPDSQVPWAIHAPISNIRCLTVYFVSFAFVWVPRSCNGVAHHAAKAALESRMSFCFHKDNLPPDLLVACKEDFPNCFLSS
ncbi:uncharacterized protein LOC112024225 [Quercus suber]|uniref:uncharacterized protein LOC112024225 n=1 Tax=Quercus suber TaxID=58331 RepID=UPI000CE18FE6|nr:uncharacterized protein LOC112024225 [Quercus suber]